MNQQDQNRSKRTFPWLFFGLTYGISWLLTRTVGPARVKPAVAFRLVVATTSDTMAIVRKR